MNTFTVHSFKTKTTFKLNVEGETLVSIEARTRGKEPQLHTAIGKDVPIENTLFRIGGNWRSVPSNDPAVRSVLEEMFNTIRAPAVDYA